MLDEGLTRRDLTALDFVTIDSASTEDMDDALYVEATADGKLLLTVAIADPTAWIAEGSKLDNAAKFAPLPTICRASTFRCCRASCQTTCALCAPTKCARCWPAA
jgi:exoribonuclease-2